MTEAYAAAGRLGLSATDACVAGELALVDRLIDLLTALEPFEIKQSAVSGDAGPGEGRVSGTGQEKGQGTGEGICDAACDAAAVATAGSVMAATSETGAQLAAAGAADTGPVPEGHAAKPSAESTRAMLARMRAVLDREAARLGEDGLEGKAAVDQVALIARTLEKIDQMERLIAEDQARAAGQRLGPQEREQLRQTVRQLILAAAERLAVERAGGPDEAHEAHEANEAGQARP
jgi:hypothetical protein